MTQYAIEHFEQVHALAGCGRLLAIGGARLAPGSEVTIFDAALRKVVAKVPLPTAVDALAFVSTSELMVGGSDGQIYRCNPLAGKHTGVMPAHGGGVAALAANGNLVASTGADGMIIVWSGDLKQYQFYAPCPQRAVALDSANRRVAAAGDDGVIRVYTFGQNYVRAMSGHRGAVNALAFTPRDGRLASTGDDGTVRFWYLEGDIECELRGEGDTGHAGGGAAFAFLPSPAADSKDSSDRLVSTGFDASIRTFRLDDKKRSKTFATPGAQRALALVESDPQKSLIDIVGGGDSRTLTFVQVGLDGRLQDELHSGIDRFAEYRQQLKTAQRPAKELLARELPKIPEAEVVPLLELLADDRETAARMALARALQQHPRRDARAVLRKLVKDKDSGVGQAALSALVAVDIPFLAYREGARAAAPAVRIASLQALPPLYPANPLVPALIAGLLQDTDAAVRMSALDALEKVHPNGVEALVTGFEKGNADVRSEVMVRALMSGRLAQLQSITGRALDDEHPMVRQMAFVARVLERPALGTVLRDSLPLAELFRRVNGGKEPNANQVAAYRSQLQIDGAAGELSQDDLTPLLVAMSAKANDIASRGAAGLLAAANDLRAVSALLQLSCDEDPAQRLWVARVLVNVRDSRALQRLTLMIDDRDATVRAAAVDGLAKAKTLSAQHQAGILLRGAHDDVRKRGLTLLVGLAPTARDDDAETMLGHALEDEVAGVRNEAFKTLWAWHSNNPRAAIDRALAGRFADLRLAAVNQLGVIAKAPADDDTAPPKNIPPWVLERLELAVADRDAEVGRLALTLWARLLGRDVAKPWQVGLEAEAVGTRLQAAQGAARLNGRAEADLLRAPLTKALADLAVPVKLAALESVDVLVTDDAGPLLAGLGSESLEVRVRAGELLARRGDPRIIPAMRTLALDAELKLRHAPAYLEPLRERAVGALATLGSQRNAALFADPLLTDDNPGVREQAARGLCNAGHAASLLGALNHRDVAVRSWAAEGLARLGDDRGLAVLTGTLKDPHLPIREGALRALAALGSMGDNALLLGLDDSDDYLSDTFFATLLARDLRAARQGHEPELLTAALSAQRPDVRYAAARALELRSDVPAYTQLLLDAVSPPRPDKAGEMKEWPAEGERERMAMQLLQLLAADTAQARYAAGQALLLRRKPLAFFAEVKRVVSLRPAAETTVPDTNPRGRDSHDAVARRDWLRKLFAGRAATTTANDSHLWLAFGAYVGLLRLASSEETVRRVRRDVVERMIVMAHAGKPAPASVVPALVRALDDEDGLVRKKAWAGLNSLLAATPDVALHHALACASADVGLLALEQLDARGEAARPWFVDALASNVADVRRQAFQLLERSYGPASLDALMAALASPHADLRLGVLQKLAASKDARVVPALRKALESDRDDVRLLAAELLAQRKDDSAVPALAAFLVPDNAALDPARAALAECATEAAAAALASHLQELAALPAAADPAPLNALKCRAMEALAATRQATGLPALLERLDDAGAEVRAAALQAALTLTNHRRPVQDQARSPELLREAKRRPTWAAGVLQTLAAAARAKDPALRLVAARELDVGAEPENDQLLLLLFADRDLATRVQAVNSYARRVALHNAPLAPLEQVAAQGTRELLLGAAAGLAERQHLAALRPLLLFARAGEIHEQVRALLALGVAGLPRALEELETLAAGGTPEAPADPLVQAAAIEALGRLSRRLEDAVARKRVVDVVEAAALEGHFRSAGVRGLLGMADERAVARLQQIAATEDDPDWPVRLEAIKALGTLADASSEWVLTRALHHPFLAPAALQALQAIFPEDPLRIALSAASSDIASISGPALGYLLAEAEPAPLLERLANPRLGSQLRAQVKFGLGRRPQLPTDVLVRHVQSEYATVRDDMAWLMARQVLAGVALPTADQAARARSLALAAGDTSRRWSNLQGADRDAEESAFLRLLWAGGLLGARAVDDLATQVLTGAVAAPPGVRAVAARLLQKSGETALPSLIQAAQDVDAEVRRAAVAGLVKVAPAKAAGLIDSGQPFDALSFDAVPGDIGQLASATARVVALPKLIAAGNPDALMQRAQHDRSPEVQGAALAALGRMGGDNVVEFLARLAFSAGGGDDDEEDYDEDDEDEDDGPSPDVSMPNCRRFEYEEDESSKFWEVAVVDTVCNVRFGRIGTAGQKKPKKLATAEAAQHEAERLIREKTGKGYEEVRPRGISPPKAVAKPAAAPAPAQPMEPWGSPELREAAFRALRRAQRTTARRQAMPSWFTDQQLDQLEANPELAQSMMPVRVTQPRRSREDDDGDEDYDYDDEDSDD